MILECRGFLYRLPSVQYSLANGWRALCYMARYDSDSSVILTCASYLMKKNSAFQSNTCNCSKFSGNFTNLL